MINKRGFTIIEMLIVVSVISLLLLLIVPNLKEKQTMINSKGCEALKQTINSQIYLYELKNDKPPANIKALIDDGFITESQSKCKDGQEIIIENNEATIK